MVEAKETKARLYTGKLLEYGYEPLRSTGICTPEKLQRYLRRMLTFRFGDDNREEVQLELTSLVAEKVAHSTLHQLDGNGVLDLGSPISGSLVHAPPTDPSGMTRAADDCETALHRPTTPIHQPFGFP